MTVIAIRSVGLSAETTSAWRRNDVQFARSDRTPAEIVGMGYNHILNLGKSSFTLPHNIVGEGPMVWNDGENIIPLLRPGATRELFGDMLPSQPTEFPADVWIKAPGSHGRGKYQKLVPHALALPPEWDWQMHVVGQEYRLITVGHKIVQDFMRHGSNGDRTYEWVAMKDTPLPIKRMARLAASRLPGHNVIAWDMLLTEEGAPYLFEGNTCPGVNEDTARRIVTEMEKAID